MDSILNIVIFTIILAFIVNFVGERVIMSKGIKPKREDVSIVFAQSTIISIILSAL